MRKYLIVLIAFSLLTSVSCQEKIDNEKEMKALVEKEIKVWNGGPLSLFDEILSPEYVMHGVDSKDIIGIDAYKEYVTSTRISFSDFNVVVDDLIIKGDKLVMRWTITGTNTGPFGDLPPTGKKFKVSGVTIAHFVDGKAREAWMFYNEVLSLSQLGFTITPPEE
jgi:steroid delta-isomerase-like uncharacterized protein